jgi:hypothetical protein
MRHREPQPWERGPPSPQQVADTCGSLFSLQTVAIRVMLDSDGEVNLRYLREWQ